MVPDPHDAVLSLLPHGRLLLGRVLASPGNAQMNRRLCILVSLRQPLDPKAMSLQTGLPQRGSLLGTTGF